MRGLQRDPGIDALRAAAALAVLAIHSGLFSLGRPDPSPGGQSALGYLLWAHLDIGVDVFFALSGYLIAGPFLRRLLDGRPFPTLRRYATRRALRVLPAYWVALAVITAAPFVGWPWWMWTMHVLLVMNPFPGQLSQGLGVAWTLHCEAVFYLLVPTVCLLFRKRRGAAPVGVRALVVVLLGIGLASFTFALLAATVGDEQASVWSRPWRLSVPATLCLFVPGMLLAVARTPQARAAWPGLPKLLTVLARPVVLAVAVASLTVLSLALDAVPSLVVQDGRRVLRAVIGGLLLAWLTSGRRHGPVVRALAPVGVVSYGLYLWHFLLQRDLELYGVFTGAAGSWGFLINVAVLTAVSLPAAALSWYVIERPALRLADRLSPNETPPPVEAVRTVPVLSPERSSEEQTPQVPVGVSP